MLERAILCHGIISRVDLGRGFDSLRIKFDHSPGHRQAICDATREALEGLLSLHNFGVIEVTDSNLDTMRRVANTGRWGATKPEVTVKITERCDLDTLTEHLGGRIEMAHVVRSR